LEVLLHFLALQAELLLVIPIARQALKVMAMAGFDVE
jgi:hypothetical protein